MPIYCIDDGGDGTQTNTTQSASTLDWSKADTSVANLIAYDANAFTTAGNIIYFGDDTDDGNKAANWTLTLPTSGLPVILVSADRTQSTPTYKKGTGNQLSSLGGNYTLTLDGSFAVYGLRMASGGTGTGALSFNNDDNEYGLLDDVTLVPGANGTVLLGGNSGRLLVRSLTLDLTADGTTARVGSPISAITGSLDLHGLTFVNPAYRTGVVVATNTSATGGSIRGMDASGFTNATDCEISNGPEAGCLITFENCKTKASPTYWVTSATKRSGGRYSMNNVGNADAPAALSYIDSLGTVLASTSIYRTGGAAVEDATGVGLLVTTTADCSESTPLYLPWMIGTISSTGSKTFDVYITNDTADFTDAEVWLEVEYLGTADSPLTAHASDHRATITTTPAAQTDDVTSTWNGTGPSFTYKQKLSVTATVNETGQYRARVCVGVASIASSRYFYVDPKVTVT